MNTCDTCKHWAWPFENNGHQHLCCHPNVGSNSVDSNKGANIEHRGSATGIITGEKFGCIFWETISCQKTKQK